MGTEIKKNIIIRFSLNEKMVILDIDKIFKESFDEDYLASLYINDVSLAINNINGLTDVIDSAYINFLYNNGFKINGLSVIGTSKPTAVNAFKKHVISPVLVDSSNYRPYTNNQAKIFTLTFDDFKYDQDNYFNFNIEIKITINATLIYDGGKQREIEHVLSTLAYIDSTATSRYSFYNTPSNMINSELESFMLLRTNPKLTGNIKLVVDSKDDLYLDSFKVSQTSILNNIEYRHQPISNDGNYPHDVYKVFHTVPEGELYNVYPDSYDPHKNYYDLNLQIENIYEYGAENNTDKLYDEGMKILAPLYIGKHLPTYFAIFKTNRLITTDYTVANSDVFKNMLVNAELVRIVDLRKHTNIGKYLYAYQQSIKEYFAGSCSLLFIELDNKNDLDNYRQGTNTWKGISVYKGILTDKNETSYFATTTLNGDNTQENYNMFLLNGYQRNGLLHPTIINLEFMFDDEDAKNMEMNNYFGLYLTENDYLTFKQSVKTNEDRQVIYYGVNDNKITLTESTAKILDDELYKDRIFFMSTNNIALQVKTLDDAKMFIDSYVLNQPDENLVSIKTSPVYFEDEDKSFITIDLTQPMQIGEHLKFVALNTYNKKKKEHIVLEIIASNDPRLIKTNNYIFPYILTNTPEYGISVFNDKNTQIYRLTFYAPSIYDYSKLATVEELLKRISACIGKFNSFLRVVSYDENTLGLISSYKDTYVEHILTDIYAEENPYALKEDTLRYFNFNNIVQCKYLKMQPDFYRSEELPFAPTGFEVLGDRYATIVKFIDAEYYKNYSVYTTKKDIYESLKNISYPIIATANHTFGPIVKHIISDCTVIETSSKDGLKVSNIEKEEIKFNSIVNPFNVSESIIATPESMVEGIYGEGEEYMPDYLINNGNINIYKPLACNFAIMGINMIKDIDMTIGSLTTTVYAKKTTCTLNAGENIKLDNSDVRVRLFTPYKIISGSINGLTASSNTVFYITNDKIIYANDSLDECKEIKIGDNGMLRVESDSVIQLVNTKSFDDYYYLTSTPLMEEDNFYIDKNDKENSKLLIPLVPAVNCQWKSNGTYFDNNSVLAAESLNLDYSPVGNFIDVQYTPEGNVKNQYIINKLSNITNYDHLNIKEMILKNAYKGFIKKYLVDNDKIDTATAYYNPNVQTLTFVYYGIQFNISLSNPKYKNDIQLNEYNNYEVYIINEYDSSHKNEIFINQLEEFILFINHTYINHLNFYNDNISILNQNGNIQSVNYNWFAAPYSYKFANTAFIGDSLYLLKTSLYDYDLESNVYVLIDTPNLVINETQNPLFYCFYNSIDVDAFSANKTYDVLTSKNNTFTILTNSNISEVEKTEYDYNANVNNIIKNYGNYDLDSSVYISKTSDFRDIKSYIIKYANENAIKKSDNVILDYIDTFTDDNMYIYIIHLNDTVTTLDINETYKPIKLQLNVPKRIKFNQGLFNPNFVDMFSFYMNDNVGNHLDLETLYANTRVKSIDSFKNYYSNKIMDNNTNCEFNYFKVDYRSPFSTCWDADIYRLYSSDTDFAYIDGYTTGVLDKMFFGSTCMKFDANLIAFTTWDYDFNDSYIDKSTAVKSGKAIEQYVIKINITKSFFKYMLNHPILCNNWSVTKDSASLKTNINNYINNTLLPMYSLDKDIEVSLYEKYAINQCKESDIFVKNTPEDFDTYALKTDITTDFEDVNGDVMLTISINNTTLDYTTYRYYPIIKIRRK